jgi:hypothetical protein
MTNLTEQMNTLRTYMDTAEKELASLHGGKKASSARTRKALGQIKNLCHLMRKEVVAHVKTMPVKKKATATMEEPAPPEPEPPAKEIKKRKTKKELP